MLVLFDPRHESSHPNFEPPWPGRLLRSTRVRPSFTVGASCVASCAWQSDTRISDTELVLFFFWTGRQRTVQAARSQRFAMASHNGATTSDKQGGKQVTLNFGRNLSEKNFSEKANGSELTSQIIPSRNPKWAGKYFRSGSADHLNRIFLCPICSRTGRGGSRNCSCKPRSAPLSRTLPPPHTHSFLQAPSAINRTLWWWSSATESPTKLQPTEETRTTCTSWNSCLLCDIQINDCNHQRLSPFSKKNHFRFRLPAFFTADANASNRTRPAIHFCRSGSAF